MTYSHNSVSKNLKMTTTTETAKTLRFKNGVGGGDGGGNRKSPPTTPPQPVTAHSNSIASSTNHYHQQQQPLAFSISPPGSYMSSSASISSNCSTSSSFSHSSLGSAGNGSGGGFYAARQRQQKEQQRNQRRSPPNSPNSLVGGGDCFFSNNLQFQQPVLPQARRSNVGGSGQKNRSSDGQRTPITQMRQSPAVILGGGSISGGGGAGSGRKNRSKLTSNQSPLIYGAGGKVSPPNTLIPTTLTHYASSKCFDAPAANALPKPPHHWTLSKTEQKAASSAGPGLHNVVHARSASATLATDAHTYGGHVVKSKRNLLDDFDTHNLKLLLNVQS